MHALLNPILTLLHACAWPKGLCWLASFPAPPGFREHSSPFKLCIVAASNACSSHFCRIAFGIHPRLEHSLTVQDCLRSGKEMSAEREEVQEKKTKEKNRCNQRKFRARRQVTCDMNFTLWVGCPVIGAHEGEILDCLMSLRDTSFASRINYALPVHT